MITRLKDTAPQFDPPRRRRFVLVAATVFIITLLSIHAPMAAKYSGDPYSLGVGARALALGGAVIAGPFDGTAPYWNPAGMSRLNGRQVVAMHAETFGSLLNHDFVAYTNAKHDSTARFNAYGLYLYYLGGGGVKLTALGQNNRPYVLREESHADLMLAGAVSGKLNERLNYGITARILYRDLTTESGMGLSADAGILWRARPHATLGLMVTDITTGFIRYSGKTFDQPHTETINPTVKPGITLTKQYREFTGHLLMSGDLKFENLKNSAQYWSGALSLDTHYGLEIGYRELLFGRAGFDIGQFTTGVGINWRTFTFDFAYLDHDYLDETLRISAGYRF